MGTASWVLITFGTIAGVFSPWKHQAVVMVVLLMGYVACFSLKWERVQALLESLYGGLATGLGLQLLIGFGMANMVIPMIIAPLILWLVLRVLYFAVQGRYSLEPLSPTSQPPQFEHLEIVEGARPEGHSAWSGDTSGKSSKPDADGRNMQYNFYCTGEIAMGGPTYGEAIFSNGCAFTGVGPSIVLSDDGRYAAMTVPSRGEWGLQLADLQEMRVYKLNGESRIWEVDRIEAGKIVGRDSPLTSNSRIAISISDLIAGSEAISLVEDDGWWVMDYAGREVFPKYEPVIVRSRQGSHQATFIPDLKPFKSNPFLRYSTPTYVVLVDDKLLDVDVRTAHAFWVDGKADDTVQDGRFLVMGETVFDFKESDHGIFSVEHHKKLQVKECDQSTYITLRVLKDGRDGNVVAGFYVMPRSVSREDGEFDVSGYTAPWDDEVIEYRDAHGIKCRQSRSRIERLGEYDIDLSKWSMTKQLRESCSIRIINRGNSAHQATLSYQEGTNVEEIYSAYTCTTSGGIVMKDVVHEMIWSHCGRYLAVVHYESPPNVPHRISIIDFETGAIKAVPGSYAMPSFIWFDSKMLEFSHVVGVRESIVYGPGKHEDNIIHTSTSEFASRPYDLLIGSFSQRRANLEKVAKSRESKTKYAAASVHQLAQHCIIFAPEFDKPVLQASSES